MILYSFIVLLFIISIAYAVNTVKIIEGMEKLSSDSSNNAVDAPETGNTPAPLSGPKSLYFLSKYCFAKTHERWEFKVCPFHQVTQQRTMGTNRVNVIGTWSHWNPQPATLSRSINDDDKIIKVYNQMVFVNGTSCGGVGNNEVIVNLACGNSSMNNIQITKVDDSQFCKHVIDLSLPMSCSLLEQEE